MVACLAFIAVHVWAGQSDFTLKTGDLLFQADGTGRYANAIASATGAGEEVTFVHVGIVIADDAGNVCVIEATPERGVAVSELRQFLDDAPQSESGRLVVVKRLDTPFDATEVCARALSHVGEEYDWWYMPDNGKMYCSELVYDAFRDAEGRPVFESRPMNFRNPDGTMPQFWTDLYAKLGQPVPEGLPGTNPNDLSRDPRLKEVGRYF